jgi:hypothetical protein
MPRLGRDDVGDWLRRRTAEHMEEMRLGLQGVFGDTDPIDRVRWY